MLLSIIMLAYATYVCCAICAVHRYRMERAQEKRVAKTISKGEETEGKPISELEAKEIEELDSREIEQLDSRELNELEARERRELDGRKLSKDCQLRMVVV